MCVERERLQLRCRMGEFETRLRLSWTTSIDLTLPSSGIVVAFGNFWWGCGVGVRGTCAWRRAQAG